MWRKLFCLLPIFVLIGVGAPVQAAVVTFDFTGAMSFTGLGFASGEAVQGSVSYDDAFLDAAPGDATSGVFGPGVMSAFTLTIGGKSLVATSLGDSEIFVSPSGDDRVTFRSFGIAFDVGDSVCNDTTSCIADLVFLDPGDSGNILASNSPPDSLPLVAQLAQFPVRFANINIVGGGNVQYSINTVTRRSIVAEPPLLLVLLFGLAGMAITTARKSG